MTNMQQPIDITNLVRQIAESFCATQGLIPDERDGYGKYRWESFIDEARDAIHLVRLWDQDQHRDIPAVERIFIVSDGAYPDGSNRCFNAMRGSLVRESGSGVHGYEISGDTIYIGPMRRDRVKVADITCTIDWDETYTDEAKERRIRDAKRVCRGLDHE